MKSGTQIERDSHVAMHRQIAQRLREAIMRGDYGADGRIPPEAELMQHFQVSRITARQAVDALDRWIDWVAGAEMANLAVQAE